MKEVSEKERLQLENELLMTCSKAQAINKYIDELEESSKLSELWCKSQQENQQLKEQQKEFISWLIENESLDDYCNETTFTSIREKYEEIIGSDDCE